MEPEVDNALRSDETTATTATDESPPDLRQEADEAAAVETQPEPESGDSRPAEPHALDPGGKRFNQVYAAKKEADRKLAAERERAARLEGELEALKRTPAQPTQPTPTRYTEAQLQQLVDEGKATMGQAMAYHAESLRLENERRTTELVEQRLAAQTKQSKVEMQLSEYRSLVPDALQVGTANHTKVMAEFERLVHELGYDKDDPRTEILAHRQAFGDPKTIRERQASRAIQPGRDTMQDITTSTTHTPAKKDPVKDLSAAQKQHYQRMIDRGVYKGWAEVKEELEFVPPRG